MNIIREPNELPAAGELPKSIYEYVGRTFGREDLSLARMVSPAGWSEPGQKPEFREITLVLSGSLAVETENGTETLRAGEAMICEPGDWVRYSTPNEPAEDVAICTPVFSVHCVNRDGDDDA